MKRLAFALVPASVVALASPASAQTASPGQVDSGWWSTSALGVTSAASATQLQVGNGPAGPTAIAAVRFAVPAGSATSGQITITLTTPSTSTIGTPEVSACPAAGTWKPGPNQPASAAPKYDCSKGAAGGVLNSSNSSEKWSIPMDWVSGGVLSVALVPTPGDSLPFSIVYDDPTPSSVAVPTAPPAPAASSSPAAAPAPSPAPASSGSPSSAESNLATGSFVSGSSAANSTPAAPIVPPGEPVPAAAPSPVFAGGSASVAGTPAGASTSGTGAGGTSAAAAGNPQGATSSAGKGSPAGIRKPGRGPRVMAFVLLVAMGAALFLLSARPERAPRFLGPFGSEGRRRGPGPDADSVPAGAAAASAAGPPRAGLAIGATARAAGAALAPVGGIGRFARPRLGPPKRL